MSSPLHLHLPTAEKTRFAGSSLAESLYDLPVTLCLTGDLGAGKTTFLQGFAEKLGIEEPLTSPTYALEQRYQTNRNIPLIHLDLYRLKERDAVELVMSTEDHEGIRCIEWSNRLPDAFQLTRCIRLHFEEDGDGRRLTIHFDDIAIPTETQIEDWRADVMLPPHIASHCEAVGNVAKQCAAVLIQKGHIVREDAVHAAARLHDLLRFIDFKGLPPPGITETKEEHAAWDRVRARFPNEGHEAACSHFLKDEGFLAISTIIQTHGIHIPLPVFTTIEQKILFYADKRCIVDKVVTLEERFDDFGIRYTNGQKTTDQTQWFGFTKDVEKELFAEELPTL